MFTSNALYVSIHTFRRLGGLPPTWSSSLADLGFSKEEISLINARRAAARSPPTPIHPNSHHVRTDSLTSSSFSHPKPRSSSLQRDLSDDGMSQRSHFMRPSEHSRNGSDASRPYSEVSTESPYDQIVYVRPTARSPDTPTLRSRSGSTNTPPVSASGNSPGLSSPRHPPSSTSPGIRPPPVASPQSARTIYTASPLANGESPSTQAAELPPSRTYSPSPPSNSSASSPSEKDKPPRTPPRRFHVANDSISTIHSPPPAYRSPRRNNTSLLEETADSDAPSPTDIPEHNEFDNEDPVPLAASSPRLPTAPPRLSLHQDDLADLSSWTASLFSIIPTTDKASSPPRSSAQHRPALFSSPAASSSSNSLLHSNNNLRSTPPTVSRQLPPQKPPPLHQLPPRDNLLPPPLDQHPPIPDIQPPEERTTPLFNEVMKMINPDKNAEYDELQVQMSSREKENRDSNVSTMTVTPATIVRDAAIVTRARANMIQSPVRDNTDRAPTTYPSTSDSDDSDDSNEARSNSPSSSESHSSGTSGAVSLSTSATGSVPVNEQQKWNSSARFSSREQSGNVPCVESSPLPSPLAGSFGKSALTSAAVRQYNPGPTVVIQDIDKADEVAESRIPSPYSSTAASPLSPCPQYPGWVSEVVAPIREFITERVDPRSLFTDLQEIAEGESGSVYVARVINPSGSGKTIVAIKNVTLVPSGTPKRPLDQIALVL